MLQNSLCWNLFCPWWRWRMSWQDETQLASHVLILLWPSGRILYRKMGRNHWTTFCIALKIYILIKIIHLCRYTYLDYLYWEFLITSHRFTLFQSSHCHQIMGSCCKVVAGHSIIQCLFLVMLFLPFLLIVMGWQYYCGPWLLFHFKFVSLYQIISILLTCHALGEFMQGNWQTRWCIMQKRWWWY